MTQSKQPCTDILCSQPATPNSADETSPYDDRAYVIAATDETSALESTPTVILCPNCGDTVATYEQGLPEVVPQFDECCTTCHVELRRWCAIAVDVAYRELVEPPLLTAMTQAYWNEWLWAGITNNRGKPRNQEYTDRLSAKASELDWDWELTCPLCRRGISQLKREVQGTHDRLDYHHWSTSPDQGITLCRECHDIIGFSERDTKTEQRAHRCGFRSRNDLQVVRLALREAIATDRPVQLEMAADLVDRYNLIQSPDEVTELLRIVLRDSDLYDRVVSDSLSNGLTHC